MFPHRTLVHITKFERFGVKHRFHPMEVQPYLSLLRFTLLHYAGVAFFYKWEARSHTSIKITSPFAAAHFIVILGLLWWSGTRPALSLRYACTYLTPCSHPVTSASFPSSPQLQAVRHLTQLTAFLGLECDVSCWYDWKSPLLWKFIFLS